jgi:tetratricopeptide (TPR) repeat protein
MLFLSGLLSLVPIPKPLLAQQDASAPVTESSTGQSENPKEPAKATETNAGQEDLDVAMDLKTSANDIDKNTKVIERIELAIKKGLAEADLELAKELLASSALDRAKLQLQEMIKARVGETMARRFQRKVMGDLELAIKNDPKLGEAHLMLAKLMLSMANDPAKAKESLDKAIEHLEKDRLVLWGWAPGARTWWA